MEINNVNKCAQCRHCSVCKYLYDRALVMNALSKDETIKNLADQSLFSLDFVCQKYERDYSKRDDDPESLEVKNNNDEEYPF